MGLLALLFRDPFTFILIAIPLLYSIIAHEVAHGWMASRFGDDTAKHAGRLTINPAPHLDPVGTLMLFLVGFGWAKPVPVNFNNLNPRRKGIIAVSLAGITTNILIATAALFLLQFSFAQNSPFFAPALLVTARINIILGSLNLIPIPPLDGSRVLIEFLPHEMKYKLATLEPYGFFILILLLWSGLLGPVINLIQGLIMGFIKLLL